jgi:LysR family nitrogen assimilation transcriptional regulator
MDLKQLEHFVRVAELESFTKASLVLSVAQSVLSKSVRHLEMELHQALLRRTGRGIQLTNEGSLLYSHAKGILQQVAQARQALSDSKQSPVGTVILGVTPSAGKAMIANFVSAFRARFPRASLEIFEAKSWTLHEWLLTGRIEVGILYDPNTSALEVTQLAKERVFVVSSTKHSRLEKLKLISLNDVATLPLILPSYPHAMRAFLESAALNAGIRLNVTLQIEGAALILELVRKGLGYTILPAIAVTEDKYSEELQTNSIIKPFLDRTLTVAISSQRPTARLAREVVHLISDQFSVPID